MDTTDLATLPLRQLPAQLETLSGVVEGLDPAENLAFNSLIAGSTVIAAGKAAGVSRNTIHRWLLPGEPLSRAMELWKQEMSANSRNRLMHLTEKATANVASAVDAGDARLSMNLLSRLGVLAGPPVGPTHQEAAAARAVVAAQAALRQEQAARKPPVDFLDQVPEFTRNFVVPPKKSDTK